MKKTFPLCSIMLFLFFVAVVSAEIASVSQDSYNDAFLTTDNAGIVAAREAGIAINDQTRIPFFQKDRTINPAFIRKSNESPQWPSPLVENCPDSSLFGQEPYTPNDDWTAGTSDQGPGYKRYEYIHTSGQICDLHWWGLSLYFDPDTGFVDCDTEVMTFDIAFYEDNGGVPGDQLCSYDNVIPNMTATSDLYNNNPLYRFDMENVAPCCSISTAWISIEGSSLSNPDCWFLWMGSGSGNSISLVEDSTGVYADDYDLSVCVTGTYVPLSGACCNDANGSCIDNIQIDQCPWPAARFVPNTLCADLYPPCGSAIGACCDDQGNCSQTLEVDCAGSWYYNTPCIPNPCPQAPPCTLSCPPNAIQEGESSCHYDWEDTTNGGCNSSIPVFSTINAGDTVCGTSGTYSVEVAPDSFEIHRDTDWYELHVTSDAMLIWSGYAEFDFQLIVIDAGPRDCNPDNYVVLQGVVVPACSTATIAVPVIPGYYWLWAGSALGTMVHCGSPYIVSVQLGAAPTGACCQQGDCVSTLTHSECNALQGDWYWQQECPDFQCPIDYCAFGPYNNGPPDGGWLLASQCAPDYPFYAGTADDFILPGSDPLHITNIVSWHVPWTNQHHTPADWTGLNITIYADNSGTTPNSPGGRPSNNDATCQHVDIITDGVVYSVTLAPGQFTAILEDVDFWKVISPVDVILDAGVTYWLEVEPIMPFSIGQVAWYSTSVIVGTIPHLIFPVAGVPNWTPLTSLPTPAPVDMAFCIYSPDWNPGGACDYTTGDVNGSNSYNGLDITYGVAFFKGGPAPMCPDCPPCNSFFYCGDVNGSCSYNGLDITYGVAYFKGGAGPIPCGDCPPNP